MSFFDICIIKTYIYHFRWDGGANLELKGGPIWLRSTCCVARIIMLFWDHQFEKTLMENNICLTDGSRYMDDVRLVLEALREGWRWEDGGLYFSEEWKKEDEASGESNTQRTSRILKDILNSILKFLKVVSL